MIFRLMENENGTFGTRESCVLSQEIADTKKIREKIKYFPCFIIICFIFLNFTENCKIRTFIVFKLTTIMDDLVVIILTLLVAAIGIWGQVKKKKQIPVLTEKDKTPGNIWNLFPDDLNLSSQSQEMEYADEEFEEVDELVEPQGYKFEPQNEGVSKIQNEKVESGSIEKNAVKREKFSLKKAVIYSEILNRKYF
jgi:hypothetical protein